MHVKFARAGAHALSYVLTYVLTYVLALLFVCTAPASAQHADTAHKFSGSGELGFVNAAGNTDVTTLNVGEQLSYAPNKLFHLTQMIAVVYGKTNGVESASLWQGNLRGDR